MKLEITKKSSYTNQLTIKIQLIIKRHWLVKVGFWPNNKMQKKVNLAQH